MEEEKKETAQEQEQEEKKDLTTLTMRNRYRGYKVGAYIGKYLAPVIPAAITTGINWDKWFQQSGTSLPMGFVTLLIAIIVSILAISKKDKLVETKVTPLIYVTLIMAIWGVAFMFLANICDQMGKLLLYTCIGLLASAASDQVDQVVIEPRLEEYNKLVDEFGLDKKAVAKQQRREQAKKDKLEKAKREAEAEKDKQPTE